MKLNVTPLMKAIERYIAKEDSDLEEQLAEEGFVEAKTAVEHITEIEDGVADALEKDTDAIVARIAEATSVDDFVETVWPEIRTAEDLTAALHDIFQKQFEDLMHSFTQNWILSQDPELAAVIDDRITNPAEDFIKGWSGELSRLMNLSSKDTIENILLTAQKENQSIETVTQAITDSGIRAAGYRSRRVAVTEVLRVEEYAHQESRVQNPSCYKKKWRHNDIADEPRQNHIDMDGQTVFKRETFTLIGRDGATYYPMCPRDTCLPASESVFCHCSTEDVVDEEVLGMTTEERLELRKKYMDEVDAEYEQYKAAYEAQNPDGGTWEAYKAYYESLRGGTTS